MSKKTFRLLRTSSTTAEHCCVPLCHASSKYNSVLSFHTFPSDVETRRKWLVAIRRGNFKVTPHTRVCSRHFKNEDVREPQTETGRRLLVKGAVPSLFKWNDFTLPTSRPGVWERRERPPPLEDDAAVDDDEVCMDLCSYGKDQKFKKEPLSILTEIPADEEEDDDEEEEEDDDDEQEYDDEDEEDEEDYSDSDYTEDEPVHVDEEDKKEWLSKLQENLKDSAGKTPVPAKKGPTHRSEVTLVRLTHRFIDLLHLAPEGILDLNEATKKLGTHKRRVYDIINALKGIKLVAKTSKSKIQWVGPSPISCFKGQWKNKNKMKTDLLNLKSMEESLDWLIKDCAEQLFALTDLTANANSAYVTYEDICRISAFQDQTMIAIRAPEETKLEVPTPTEDCIKMHLKGSRGPVQVLTCDTYGPDTSSQSRYLKHGRFLTLEESRIQTEPLLTDAPTISSVRSA